jgi:pimeloyl-ACP methyl ester carboxylesterase
MRRAIVAAAVLAAGCGGSSHHPRRGLSGSAGDPAGAVTTAPKPRLRDVARCKTIPHATCATLRVPLDHGGRAPGTLDLPVAYSGPAGAPVLVLLSGGPGQPGQPFLAPFRNHLGPAAKRWRLVVIDQRGTGRDALRCPALQRAMGASDLTPPSASAVRGCAAAIGARRRFFATTDTVADLDDLRVALGAGKLALDGVSYGTYVAERYALAHPDRTSRLILDSVVPHAGVTLYSEVPLRAAARVLGPAATSDLKADVARYHDGPQLFDLITTLSIGRPRLGAAASALKDAREGNLGPLTRLQANVSHGEASFGASALSQGLHASTLCADTPAPWGGESAPAAGREQRLRAGAAALDLGPFDEATALGNGIALTCLYWPPTPVPLPRTAADLPNVPTLLINGTEDLSTPYEWAQAEAAHAPGGHLMLVPGAGHSVQSQEVPAVERALARFLAQ